MPTSNSDSTPTESAELTPALLDGLRDDENPFNDFVHPAVLARSMSTVHVPEINVEVRQKLELAIERFRRAAFDDQDIQDQQSHRATYSGVILIKGKRGAGKTHLVNHGLNQAAGAGPTVVPRFYDTNRPFPEYLLHQLVQVLEAESSHCSQLNALANWFTRRVLIDAVESLSETDWFIFHSNSKTDSSRWARLMSPALSFQADSVQQIRHEWKEGLAGTGVIAAASLNDFCESVGVASDQVSSLALAHINRRETGRTIGDLIRHRLYAALIEHAFTETPNALNSFLSDEYTQVSEGEIDASRGTLVEELLGAIVELFVLFGRPVVFAFDALESLLGEPPDPERCGTFHSGIAELVESLPAMPIFVFAESGYWESASKHFSQYAMQRWERGIPIRRHGTIHSITMPLVNAKQLEQVVTARMKPLLTKHLKRDPAEGEILLPFTSADVEQVAASFGESPPLRQALQQLRDRYELLVFSDPNDALDQSNLEPARSVSIQPSADDCEFPAGELQNLWTRELRAAERKLESTRLTVLSDDLHAGLSEWLRCLKTEGSAVNGWRPVIISPKFFGNHASYGQLLECWWSRADEECQQGIGLLLATGSGLPNDLKTKLTMMSSSSRVVGQLRIIWPKDIDAAQSASAQLPAASTQLWNQHVKSSSAAASRVQLASLSPMRLATWLAVISLKRSLADRGESEPERLSHFVVEQTRDQYAAFAPEVAEVAETQVAVGEYSS